MIDVNLKKNKIAPSLLTSYFANPRKVVGLSADIGADIAKAGANVLAAGTAIFRDADPYETICALRERAARG